MVELQRLSDRTGNPVDRAQCADDEFTVVAGLTKFNLFSAVRIDARCQEKNARETLVASCLLLRSMPPTQIRAS